MPYVHRQTFTIRHYECDATEYLHPANYLRYMQEAAFGASAAVGFSAQRYAELGYHWFAYETDFELTRPLRYGEQLVIKTWVEDFRRVRSLRRYELYTTDGTAIARASTDWVLIESTTQRPVTIPQFIIDAYAQGEAVEIAPRRPALPMSPRPKTGIFTMQQAVQWHNIDPAGHVNNAAYLDFIIESSLHARKTQQNMPAGIMAAACRYQITYKLAAQYDDLLEISTWFSNVRHASAVSHTNITRASDQKLLVQARARLVWINRETGAITRVPAEEKALLLQNGG